MAMDDAMHRRLQEWAAWVTVGNGSGYPAVNVLHGNWSPPSPGTTPTLKVNGWAGVLMTHRAVGRLSVRMRNTVVLYYCTQLSVSEQACRLECTQRTVHERIAIAHRLIRDELEFRHIHKVV